MESVENERSKGNRFAGLGESSVVTWFVKK